MNNKKIKVYKLIHLPIQDYCVFLNRKDAEEELEMILDDLDGRLPGDYKIIEEEMTQKEFNELPEWNGF